MYYLRIYVPFYVLNMDSYSIDNQDINVLN